MEKTDEVFTAVFDASSPYWHADPDYNRVFLQAQQNYFNHLLNARGHVFLNEIHDGLGLNRTSKGQIVGWLSKDTSNHIDFNVEYDDHTSAVILTFNVQGAIFEEIE
jgi:hypothetical protein